MLLGVLTRVKEPAQRVHPPADPVRVVLMTSLFRPCRRQSLTAHPRPARPPPTITTRGPRRAVSRGRSGRENPAATIAAPPMPSACLRETRRPIIRPP